MNKNTIKQLITLTNNLNKLEGVSKVNSNNSGQATAKCK